MKRTSLHSSPEKTRAWIDRSRRRLPAESEKKRRARAARARVLEIVRARDVDCVARDLVPTVECHGRRDVHETAPRSVYPGGELDVENAILLCRAHHEWTHAQPYRAHALGLRRWSWEVAQDEAEQLTN